jgi:hypothetical protein
MKLLVAFAPAPAAHWVPRLQAGGVDAVAIAPPTVGDDGVVAGLPAPQDGVLILVNARVAGAMKGVRTDLVALPQGAAQDGSPVGLDFLVKV